jgi:hypothetical protein
MKNKKSILSLLAVAFSLCAVQAQQGTTKLTLGYNVASPTGSFKNMVSNTSYRGFQGTVLYGVSEKLSLGAATGFQDFYQKNGRHCISFQTAAIFLRCLQTLFKPYRYWCREICVYAG